MPTITSNGVEMNYIREGSGEPVLLVPGLLFGAKHWRPQIDALKGDYDVIALDLRGQHGSQTTDDPAAYDMWAQMEDVYGVIQQLGIAPVHYVGLSMGGFIGMRMALKHPEALRDLALIDTTDLPENPELAAIYEAFRQILWDGGLENVISALPGTFFRQEYIDGRPDDVEAWLNDLRAGNHRGSVLASRGVDERDDISDRTPQITLPTLVIHGTEDVAIPLERAEALAGRIPGARLEKVEGAGHQSNVDTPEEISSIIKDWLAEVRQRSAAGAQS
ncbi:MAG TPA: alpha/beta hydrolase [Candidatus Dormibacteraeota bacterium]|jgi:pimeloyl-ACP methyl ester carboxylesterase|nr:alpha/beta hydrolase [Candidatus Dormibacteraeota bacterium]